MIDLNHRDPRPIYLQLKDSLRQQILAGALAEGEQLPSVRETAMSLAINPNTIQRAYRELEAEGWLQTVPGKGSFVRGSAEARRGDDPHRQIPYRRNSTADMYPAPRRRRPPDSL